MSQQSDIEICNIGLSFLGEGRIDSFTEPGVAQQCGLVYPVMRDVALEAAVWRWSKRRRALAQLATNPRPESWAYAYAKPAGALRIVWVQDAAVMRTAPRQPYEIEGDTIYSDVAAAQCLYTELVTDPTAWSHTFRLALSWAVAVALAMSITQQRDRAQMAAAEADAWLDRALAVDVDDEDHEEDGGTVSWLNAAGFAPDVADNYGRRR